MPANDDPPYFAVALDADNFASSLLKKTKSFVINVPEKNLAAAVKACGTLSGRDADKFAAARLSRAPGLRVATPHVEECFAFIECRAVRKIPLGGADLWIGRAVYAAADPRKFKDGRLAPGVKTLHHLGRMVFAVPEIL
jgi:flavin reductase (DIM6/NTAB) family NADH-FMN oxidoreductase RutF